MKKTYLLILLLILSLGPSLAQNLVFPGTTATLFGPKVSLDVNVAINDQGIALVAWAQDSVRGQIVDVNGNTLTGIFQIDEFGTYIRGLKVETDASGAFTVFWAANSNGNKLFAKKYDANGNEIIAQTFLSNYYLQAKFAVNASGYSVLVQHRNTFFGQEELRELILERFNPQFQPTQPLNILYSYLVPFFVDLNYLYDIALTEDDNVYVLHDEPRSFITNDTIFFTYHDYSRDTTVQQILSTDLPGLISANGNAVIKSHDLQTGRYLHEKLDLLDNNSDTMSLQHVQESILDIKPTNEVYVVEYTDYSVFPYEYYLGMSDASLFTLGNTINTNTVNIPELKDYDVNTSYEGYVVGLNSNQVNVRRFRVNMPPEDLILSNTSVIENKSNIDVGKLHATDPNADELKYSLAGGFGDDDNDKFSINGIALILDEAADYESDSIYSVRIRVDDQQGQVLDKVFEIKVTDDIYDNPNAPPSGLQLSNNTIVENNIEGDTIGVFTATDTETPNQLNFWLTTDGGYEDNNSFLISGSYLVADTVFDFEDRPEYTIQVVVGDPEDSVFVDSFLVEVLNDTSDDIPPNTPPYGLTLNNNSIVENNNPGETIGTFSAMDQETPDQLTYQIVDDRGSQHNEAFQINNNLLVANTIFDFESQSSYTIEVAVSDPEDSVFRDTFEINILNDTSDDAVSNTPPFGLSLNNNAILENNNVGDTIAAISALDQETPGQLTFELVENKDNDYQSFVIQGDRLLADTIFDFEAKAIYNVEILVRDPSDSISTSTFKIRILDELENDSISTRIYENFSNIKLYPNPVTKDVTLLFPEKSVVGITSLKLTSPEGKVLWSERIWAETLKNHLQIIIDRDSIPHGFYVLKVENYTSSKTFKLYKP